MPNVTKQYICDGISKSLIEFGYPDAAPAVIAEIYDAFKAGKRFPELPHGIVGGFAEAQLKEVAEMLKVLP